MALNGPLDRDGTTPSGGARGVPQECPDAERLAEYAEGLLDPAARAAIEAHLITCADCRFAVVETMAFLGAEAAAAAGAPASATLADTAAEPAPAAPAADTGAVKDESAPKPTADDGDPSTSTGAPRVVPFRTRSWVTGVGAGLAVAAALVLVVGTLLIRPVWLPPWLGGRPLLEDLVAALETQPVRPVEGRLMGGFAYAPPPSPTRGGADRLGRAWSGEVKIATATLQSYAEGTTSADVRAALGVALIVDGDLDDAIIALEQAAKDRPDDAATHANLSAAYLARARWFNHPEDWPKALAAAERAATLDANAPEPSFNRALALEGLGRTEDAAKAWADYVSRDRDSGWGREAEGRRRALLEHQP